MSTSVDSWLIRGTGYCTGADTGTGRGLWYEADIEKEEEDEDEKIVGSIDEGTTLWALKFDKEVAADIFTLAAMDSLFLLSRAACIMRCNYKIYMYI
jgi:hypothetical protein